MTRMQKWTLVAAVLASATVFLDSTVVNVALPRIGRALPTPLLGVLEGQTYVYTGYLLSLSTLLILAGALTDAYGRRRVFMLGLAGFGITSGLCGLAPNLESLVVLRVLQGIAGAFLVPGSLALITTTFSGPLQGRAFGIWSGASSGTTLIGPAVGGLLVDTISWRAAFFINLPTLLIYGALYVSGYNQALFVQGTLGYTAVAAGLMFIPGGLLLTVMSPRVGTLVGRYGARPFLIVGPLVMAAACLLYARVPATSTAWMLKADSASSVVPPVSYLVDFLPATLIFCIGLGIMVAPLTAALMASVPVANAGLASSINNAISRIGPQLAGAVVFIAVTAVFYASLAAKVPGLDPNSPALRAEVSPLNRPTTSAPAEVAAQARYASADAFHTAMLISAGLLIAGAAANAIGVARKQPESEPLGTKAVA